jgi:hypothetical protein
MSESISNLKAIVQKNNWNPRLAPTSRRVGHGGMAWATNSSLKQPQDGSSEMRDTASRITSISTRMQVATFGGAPVVEPEDARLTGGTRSLVRRLMGLNIMPRVISTATAKKAARPAKKTAPAAANVQVA